MVSIVDVDSAAQATTVVGGSTAPVKADIVDKEYGDGAEVDLPEGGRVKLKSIP